MGTNFCPKFVKKFAGLCMKEIFTCKAKDDWFAADGGVVRPDMRDVVDRTDRLALPFLQQHKQHCQTAAGNTSYTDLFPLNRVGQKNLKGSYEGLY